MLCLLCISCMCYYAQDLLLIHPLNIDHSGKLIRRIMFYTQLGLKTGPRSLYLLYLSPRPNGIMKIKLKDITFQNFMKCPWSSKMKKNNGFLTSLSFSLSLSLSFYSLYLSLTEKSTIPPSIPCLHFFQNKK